MNWKAEILNLGEGEKKGSFFLTLMGQIRYDFKVIYTETRTFEIDPHALEQSCGGKDAFAEQAADALKKYLDLLIEQKFMALEATH